MFKIKWSLPKPAVSVGVKVQIKISEPCYFERFYDEVAQMTLSVAFFNKFYFIRRLSVLLRGVITGHYRVWLSGQCGTTVRS